MNDYLNEAGQVTLEDLKAGMADRDVVIISMRKQLDALMKLNNELANQIQADDVKRSQEEFQRLVESS